jgi:osmoprotectant transport system ATP-binding protein
VVEFHHVSFAFPGRPVLRDVSLAVSSGEVVALVGPSGCGKTTLLRLVNRMLSPDSGRVLVDGRDVAEWDAVDLRRRTGYAIQDVGLFPHWTVEANVGTVPRLFGWSAARVRDRVDELLTLVGLPPEEYRERWPDELSGGQRQRVGLARALAAEPPLLLMDEPFAAVDPLTRRDLHREFLRLHGAVPGTVLIVTHDLDEAWALADRIAVMDGGALVACDRPAALAASEAPFVRRLLESRGPLHG